MEKDVEETLLAVPGASGWKGTALGILADKTLPFARNPMHFVHNKIAVHGPVFQCRILSRPTVFVTTYVDAHGVMASEHGSMSSGYGIFMEKLYGKNVLLLDGLEWANLREPLRQSCTGDKFNREIPLIVSIIHYHLQGFCDGDDVALYETFKGLAVELCLKLFLELDVQDGETISHIKELCRDHWRGLVSLHSKVSPQFKRALLAKEKLLHIIQKRLESRRGDGFLNDTLHACRETEATARQLLLYVSALVPKALASLLTSATIQLGQGTDASRKWVQRCRWDRSYLMAFIKEVARLYPPFLGALRISKGGGTMGGFCVPPGTCMLVFFPSINRDASKFPDPGVLRPERWLSKEQGGDGCQEKVWTFGGGERECIGQHLVSMIVEETMSFLLDRYEWQLDADSMLHAIVYKWMPVGRPARAVRAHFSGKPPMGSDHDGLDAVV
eukprot:jgi/Mesvir1/29231/Mv18824-RA.1